MQQVEGGLLDRHVEVGVLGLVGVGDEPRLRLIDRNRLGQVTRRYAVALSRGRAPGPGARGAGRLEGVIPPGPLIRRLVSWRVGPRRLSRPYRFGGPGRLRGPRRL